MARHEPPLSTEQDIRIPRCVGSAAEAMEILTPEIRAFDEQRAEESTDAQ